ncbi:MAG TPA: hypothetical protein VD996_09090 [Chitinophagaceae bacterium]|nr:hypothetical protein [Chitinophagaceae bacterium]
MKDINNSPFRDAFEYLFLALRYIASGFVCVGVYMFLYDLPLTFEDNSWFLLFLTSAIGLITYAFHFATLDKKFYIRSAYSVYKESKHVAREVQAAIRHCDELLGVNKHASGFNKGDVEPKELFFALSTQTYLRTISESRTVRDLQYQMEKRLAFLNFLYCSFYQVVVLVSYFIVRSVVVGGWATIGKEDWIRIFFLGTGAFILFISTRIFNKRICKREIWAIITFYQCVPSGAAAPNTDALVSANPPSIKSLLADMVDNLKMLNKEIMNAQKTIE